MPSYLKLSLGYFKGGGPGVCRQKPLGSQSLPTFNQGAVPLSLNRSRMGPSSVNHGRRPPAEAQVHSELLIK